MLKGRDSKLKAFIVFLAKKSMFFCYKTNLKKVSIIGKCIVTITTSPAPDHNLDIGSLGMFESAVSSTLKAYFKLLPDPLISENVAAQLLVINCECVYM